MERPERYTTQYVAQRMRKGEIFVRAALERGLLPFGTGFLPPGSKVRSFYINPEAFEKYMAGELSVIMVNQGEEDEDER